MGVFCSFMGSDIFLFQPSNDFVEQPKFPHPVCVFCGGRRGKILPCVFPDWGLLVWKYFSVEFFPFRRNASLLAKKSEGGGVKRSPNCGLFGRVSTVGATGAWSSAHGGGFLRLQAAGLFVEVPYFKAKEKCLLSIEASRAGIFHPESGQRSTVMAWRGAQLFDAGEAWDTGAWKREEHRQQFLAMELQSSDRRGAEISGVSHRRNAVG
eukprot:symbB.v1.2.029820.t1/scaffold3305.1/size59406/1